MRDLINNISVTQLQNPILATTTRTSAGLDTQGYDSCVVMVHFGFALDALSGSVFWTAKLQHSDNNSTYTDVVADDVYGGVVSYVVNSSTLDERTYVFGYKGTKRYVRVTIIHTGIHTSGTPIGATGIRGNAAQAPVV